MGKGDSVINYPSQPSYGEGMREALDAQVALLTGTRVGESDFTGVGPLSELVRDYEAPLRKEAAQIDTDVLQQTMLGTEKIADEQGRVQVGHKRVNAESGEEIDSVFKNFNGRILNTNTGEYLDPMNHSKVLGNSPEGKTLFYDSDEGPRFTDFGSTVLQEWAKETGNDAKRWETQGSVWSPGRNNRGLDKIKKGALVGDAFTPPGSWEARRVLGVPTEVFDEFLQDKTTDLLNNQLSDTGVSLPGTKLVPVYQTDENGNVITDQTHQLKRAGKPVQMGGGMVDLLGDSRELQRAVRQEDGTYKMEGVGRKAGFSEDEQFLGLSAFGEDIQAQNLSRQRQRDLEDVARLSPLYKEIMDQFQPGTQEAIDAARKLLEDRGGAFTGAGGSLSDAQTQVRESYLRVLGREPDPAGLAHWTDALQKGASVEDMNMAFAQARATGDAAPVMEGRLQAQARALGRAASEGLDTGAAITAPTGTAATSYLARGVDASPLAARTDYTAAQAAAGSPLGRATGYDASQVAGVAGPAGPTSYDAERAAAVDPLSAAIAYDASRVGGVRDLSAATQYDPTAVQAVNPLTAPTSYDAMRAEAIDPLSAATSYDPSADLDSGRIGGAYEVATGRGTGDIRSALMEDAYTGLGEGLTAREQEQIEQAARRRATALGRAFDRGSIADEVQARVLEDRNRQAQNRAFAQSVLGQEAGMQTSELGRSLQAQMGNQAARNRAAEFGVQAGMTQEQAQAQFAQQKALADQAAANQAAQYGIGARLQQEQMEAQMAQQKAMADAAAANRAAEFGVESGMQQEQTAAQMEQQRAMADAAAANRAAEFGVGAGLERERASAEFAQQKALADQAAANRAAEFGVSTGMRQSEIGTQMAQQKALADAAAANQAAQFGIGAGLQQEQLGAQLAQQRALSDQAAANRAAEFGVGTRVAQEQASRGMDQAARLATAAAENRAAEMGMQAGLQQQQFAAGQDIAAQAMNREAAMQGSQFDILQDIARQESNIGRELSAAESDLERDYRQKFSQEQLAQQGLLGYMDATTRLAGLERATTQDPIAGILNRAGGGSLQAGQGVFGQAGYGLQSGPQYLNPESGLGFIQNQATNQANMFNAQIGADATRQAGLYNMIGSIGGAATGAAFCWVAREVYGAHNPAWLDFRQWMFSSAPRWFFKLYLTFGERFANFISNKPRLKARIRLWMDSKIGR